jgi:hypothetical protein
MLFLQKGSAPSNKITTKLQSMTVDVAYRLTRICDSHDTKSITALSFVQVETRIVCLLIRLSKTKLAFQVRLKRYKKGPVLQKPNRGLKCIEALELSMVDNLLFLLSRIDLFEAYIKIPKEDD